MKINGHFDGGGTTAVELLIDNKITNSPLPGYRPNAVAVVIDDAGNALLARRKGDSATRWQFPQGGIEMGETPLEACLRELHEETGLDFKRLQLAGYAPHWISYDIPERFRLKSGLAEHGQVQAWFLLALAPGYSPDLAKCIASAQHEEFDLLDWKAPKRALGKIIEFKSDAYRAALTYFATHIMNDNPMWAPLAPERH